MFLILLAFEPVYFYSILWPSRPRNVCQRRRTLARSSRHGRNSPAAGARPAQTSSLLHPMRTDVPEDDPRILGTDKSRNESGRDFNGVEWWPVPSGALSQQHVPNWKSNLPGVCNRDEVPWHSIIFTGLAQQLLEQIFWNFQQICGKDARFVCAMFYFSLKRYSEDIDKEALLFGTPMYFLIHL